MTDKYKWADNDHKWQIIEERKYMWHEEQIDRLAAAMELTPKMTNADVGCGLGYLGWTYWKHYGIGARVPRMMHEAGLKKINGFCRDKLEFLVPPYKDPQQKLRIDIIRRFSKESTEEDKQKAKEEYRKYYLTGGGDAASFEKDYNRLSYLHQTERDKRRRQVEDGNLYACSGGSNFFCIFGRKSNQ